MIFPMKELSDSIKKKIRKKQCYLIRKKNKSEKLFNRQLKLESHKLNHVIFRQKNAKKRLLARVGKDFMKKVEWKENLIKPQLR